MLRSWIIYECWSYPWVPFSIALIIYCSLESLQSLCRYSQYIMDHFSSTHFLFLSLSILLGRVFGGLFACCYCLRRKFHGTIKGVSVDRYTHAGVVFSQITLLRDKIAGFSSLCWICRHHTRHHSIMVIIKQWSHYWCISHSFLSYVTHVKHFF